MIVERLTADRASDRAAKRGACERHDVPADIITHRRIVERQVEAGNRGAAEANSLERQIPCAAVGDAQPLNEQFAPGRPALVGFLPGEFELVRSVVASTSSRTLAC